MEKPPAGTMGTKSPRRRSEQIIRGVVFSIVGAIVLLYGFEAAYLIWHTSKCKAFCKTVAALPHEELKDFASRCDALRSQTNSEAMIVISERDTLNRFTLAGHSPKAIRVFPRGVSFYYLGEGRLAARISWENSSYSGEPRWVLTGTPGDTPGNVLYDP
jgi:hypothetical protein